MQRQCSPQSLAQQVRDHSWPVRPKCPKGARSWEEGGGGGGGRKGRGPYYRGVLTGRLDHVNVTFLGPYEPTIIRLCPYYKNGPLRAKVRTCEVLCL